ncbi:HlyD family efflux transporter periplasmic adaptor subunit [Methylocystis parvus]|uniref:HlyD family efflux transporter periplasmic adaptor subunit n=1 Tax=Methylocystis parvus TaxID=134 RepID=A0A6B8M5E6_9HYPH|nr:HlyD family efflux transporter periplasmic adaptor subunit [Methylocystis parvus]QGM96050.1 HlyD family efflux transporter periplasmic adaptor subunit [Methylocystis parvus]WBK00136.1 HlyD family efflux transporter periplasmic adaptor subunit [Methylocystis parvus OBBP]
MLSRRTIRARRNFLLKLLAVGVGVGALAAAFRYFAYDRDWVTTDNAFVTGNIIPVQSDATGVVAQVLAEETQLVKKGDVLVRLDAQRARAALGQAEAELGRAVRNVGALFANRRQFCQKVTARAAIRERTRHDLSRYKQAASSGAASSQLLQNTQDTLNAQEADLREARAELAAIESRVGGVTPTNHPDIEFAKARFNEAYIEFLRQNIRAPATGYVAKRRVQVGQRLRPGDQILNIVPLDHLWVEANLWENRMSRIRPGQPATIKVDLYGSSETFHGTVEGLVPGSGSVFATLPPDNATGNFIRIVQRIPIRIAIDPEELKKTPLRPGLSTVTSINVSAEAKPANDSIVKTSAGEYSTEVFDKDLAEAKARADKVVRENLVPGVDAGDGSCAAAE